MSQLNWFSLFNKSNSRSFLVFFLISSLLTLREIIQSLRTSIKSLTTFITVSFFPFLNSLSRQNNSFISLISHSSVTRFYRRFFFSYIPSHSYFRKSVRYLTNLILWNFVLEFLFQIISILKYFDLVLFVSFFFFSWYARYSDLKA